MTKAELILLGDYIDQPADMILPLFVPEFESDEVFVEVIKNRLGDFPPVMFDTYSYGHLTKNQSVENLDWLQTKVEGDRTWWMCENEFDYRAVWIYIFGWRNKIDLPLRLSKLVFPLWLSIERVFDADGQYVDDSIMEQECTL